MNPVVHFEMAANDLKRMSDFRGEQGRNASTNNGIINKRLLQTASCYFVGSQGFVKQF